VEREAKRSCDTVGHVPGGIGDPTLKPANGCGVELRSISQSLLSQPDFFAAQTDRSPEGNLGTSADPHA